MSERQTKKLKTMAKLFYHSMPPDKRKSVDQIFQDLKNIHKTKLTHGNKNQNKTAKKVIT